MRKILTVFAAYILVTTLSAQKLSVLKDIRKGVASSNPSSLTLINDKLYFAADDSLHGNELWVSSGTGGTTNFLVDVNPGTAASNPQNLIYFKGALFFTANDGKHGIELWKLNLSNNSLKRLTNTSISSPFQAMNGFIIYKNKLYFSFNDGIHGSEVWETDGTITGTKLVADVRLGDTNPRDFFIFKNRLFFHGDDFYQVNIQALYVMSSDGSINFFFNCGEDGCSNFTILNDAFYFFSDDMIISHPDMELYKSDGTSLGTNIVKQINPIGWAIPYVTGSPLVASNNELFFTADDGVHGFELWKSDGTADGTQMVKDIDPGESQTILNCFIPYHNKIIFQAWQYGKSGTWISDGTDTGTIKLADTIMISASPGDCIIANNKLFFRGYVGNYGYELCVTDGTPAGTKLKLDINKGTAESYPSDFIPWDSTLFFVADDDVKGTEVFRLSPLKFNDTSTASIVGAVAIYKPSAWLSQNSPNPFKTNTQIQYSLPAKYNNAKLVVYNATGRLIRAITLTGNGMQTFNLNGADLAAGIYYYNLVVDGTSLNAKKCIVIK